MHTLTVTYKPVWPIETFSTIREHLMRTHHLPAEEVDMLSDTECWIAHDQIHASELGRAWLEAGT